MSSVLRSLLNATWGVLHERSSDPAFQRGLSAPAAEPDAPYARNILSRTRSTCYIRTTAGCKNPGLLAARATPTREPAGSSRRIRDSGLGIGDVPVKLSRCPSSQ